MTQATETIIPQDLNKASTQQEPSPSHLTTRKVEPKVELAQGNFATVHADKAMIAIDHESSIATLTFLNAHPIPQPRPSGAWDLSSIMWDIVGEVKISLPALNALLLYYISVISNGLDIIPLIQKHLAEHPLTHTRGWSYGPLLMTSTDPQTRE